MSSKITLTAALAGALFGSGLVLSGMTNPAKVLGFLNLAGIANGTWDPTLAFVLGGAVITTFIGFRLVWRCPKPLCAPKFNLPTATQIDKPLLIGSTLFGIGWGLAGYCPGPALASLAAPTIAGLGFFAAMVAGMALAKILRP